MAIICREYRLLFIMVPGTGCSSVGDVLFRQFGGQWLPENDVMDGARRLVSRKHSSVAQLLEFGFITPDQLRHNLTFATIRNPFDSLVTTYQRLTGEWTELLISDRGRVQSMRGKPSQFVERVMRRKRTEIDRARRMGFEGWLRRLLRTRTLAGRTWMWARSGCRLARARERIYQPYPMIDGVHQLMRYERLHEDLNRILQGAGVTRAVDMPRRNVTPGKRPYTEYYSTRSRTLVERRLGRELDRFGYRFGMEGEESCRELPKPN